MPRWEIEHTDRFEARYKRFEKKHPGELKALLSNLERFKGAVEAGIPPHFVEGNFIHNEPDGIKAIDQRGAYGKGLKECRLYLWACEEDLVLHLLSIGDKSTQRKDIPQCQKEVRKLKKGKKGDSHG